MSPREPAFPTSSSSTSRDRERLVKPGIPVRRRILLLNIRTLQRALPQLAKKRRAGAEAEFFVWPYGPTKVVP